MGKINASLASVQTEFQLVDPGIYEFDVKKAEAQEKDGILMAYRINSEVNKPGDENHGRTFSDYINLRKNDGTFAEAGLASLKRYFEAIYGIDEVSGPLVNGKRDSAQGWTDDQFDTDLLLGKRWRGQIEIRAYTKKGETEPRKVNNLVMMEGI